MAKALATAKEAWTSRKKPRLNGAQSLNVHASSPSQGTSREPRAEQGEHVDGGNGGSDLLGSNRCVGAEANLDHPLDPTVQQDDLDLALAQRRTRRANRRLPMKYRDFIPQPAPALPPQAALPLINLSVSPTSEERATPPSSDVTDGLPRGRFNAIAQKVRQIFRTPRNVFGLSRQYKATALPSHDPEEHLQLSDLTDIPSEQLGEPTGKPDSHHNWDPYPNESSFRLGEWFWADGERKSKGSLRNLLSIVGSEDFQPSDVRHSEWDHIDEQLGDNVVEVDDESPEWMNEDAGWHNTPVTISIPFHRNMPNPGIHEYVVEGFHHRHIISVIREALSDPAHHAARHFEPYEMYFQRPHDADPMRVYGEAYTSPAFIDAHNDLQDMPSEPNCDLPKVMLALMLASDETRVTSFSDSSVWPLYMTLGNDSKYTRCRPSANLFSHLAYFCKLPDSFKDFICEHTGNKNIDPQFMAHCNRELLHAQLKILLSDGDLIHAYHHGIVITCCDGIKRRFYPRFFTYSADYPEKAKLVSIRDMGRCPCPRCCVAMVDIHSVAMKRDMANRDNMARTDDVNRRTKVDKARSLIYQPPFYAVNSAVVERLLFPHSLVPINNAFSELSVQVAPIAFDMHSMFVVDLMHEIELGVWKPLFIHLLRILDAHDPRLLHELDRRYRQIPTFGRDSIRRFTSNVSELKKMTARDFEDLLQCAIPAFDGLLPAKHNRTVLQLLFVMAHWHGLAKLRLHHELSLKTLDETTVLLGDKLRYFVEHTCANFATKELDREAQARRRRAEKASQAGPAKKDRTSQPQCGRTPCDTTPSVVSDDAQASTSTSSAAPSSASSHLSQNMSNSSPTEITLAMSTSVPAHALAPSPAAIESHSHKAPTCEPSTTSQTANPTKAPMIQPQPGQRKPKTFNLNTYKVHALGDYANTIRRFGTTDSYTTEASELEHRKPKRRVVRTNGRQFVRQIARIERRETRIRRICRQNRASKSARVKSLKEDISCTPDMQYEIGKTQNEPIHLIRFLQRNALDPAVKDFVPRLKEHLLPRILERIRLDSGGDCDIPGPGDPQEPKPETVLFKNDIIYNHRIARFNYTTYDVRRAQDVINPGTSHCNIMVLAQSDAAISTTHPYWYARVLGVYHVNVVYVGPGMTDYTPRRYDFLWVRWYRMNDGDSIDAGWKKLKMDQVYFPPVTDDSAFAFLDPRAVLRSSHIIQSFAAGLKHSDGIGLSACARDSQDWRRYYVSRFVDRDMVIRYHWGYGVGHVYTHNRPLVAPATARSSTPNFESELTATAATINRDSIDTQEDPTIRLPDSSDNSGDDDEWYDDPESSDDEEIKDNMTDGSDDFEDSMEEMYGGNGIACTGDFPMDCSYD